MPLAKLYTKLHNLKFLSYANEDTHDHEDIN